MSFPIYELIKSVRVYVRYYQANGLTGAVRQLDDCFATTIEGFRFALLRIPGLAAAVSYGKNTRPDIKAFIKLEWSDRVGHTSVEFETAKAFIDFVKERPALAKALEYNV